MSGVGLRSRKRIGVWGGCKTGILDVAEPPLRLCRWVNTSGNAHSRQPICSNTDRVNERDLTASETFARALHVLTIENDNLRRGSASKLH